MTEPSTAPDSPAAAPSVETWWELPTTDLERSAAFYGAVFGWGTEPMGDGYLLLTQGETMLGGLFAVDSEIGTGIRLSFTVPDLEATLAAVVDAGGTVATERTEIAPEMGWWAEFRDPIGLLVGLSTQNPQGD